MDTLSVQGFSGMQHCDQQGQAHILPWRIFLSMKDTNAAIIDTTSLWPFHAMQK
jgi:hypothetical protein